MKISLRLQLAVLLVLSGAIGLAVLAIATWVVNHDFVLSVSASRLEITALLKAAQVAYNLELMQIAATFIAARSSIQNALLRYNNGTNTTSANWNSAAFHLQDTLRNAELISTALVLQCQVFAANTSGPNGTSSVMSVTGPDFTSIKLPWLDADDNPAYLGEPDSGYPKALYPNLTISEDSDGMPLAVYNGVNLDMFTTLVLGPISINSTFSLLSLTLPVVTNNSSDVLIGWITVVLNARLIREVFEDGRGLGNSGETLLLGPNNPTNLFSPGVAGNQSAAREAEVRYAIPLDMSARRRHPTHVSGTPNLPFYAEDFPAVRQAIYEDMRGVNDVGSIIRSHNEANKKVSVGYSIAPTKLVDWIIIIEQARGEVWKPIDRLRTIILACLFGVIGFMMIISFPLAHWAVSPIMRMRASTAQTIVPRSESFGGSSDSLSSQEKTPRDDAMEINTDACKLSFLAKSAAKIRAKKRAYYHVERRQETRGRIPGKIPVRKQPWIKDEMYELVVTFNSMSDELVSQYSKLEERVQKRTIELEHSKKAAEAANESKTLFIANLSHELRTPLNGILGLTAVCMEEEDPVQLKKSLGIIYSSGDLLLRTLTDLLSFSANQVGHQTLCLDEKEFVLRDLESQAMAIFGEQAKDNHVDFRVVFEETPGDMLYGTGNLRDVTVYADVHRILQVIINLVSNSLKFTPVGGSVTMTIKCLSEAPTRMGSLLKGRRALATETGDSTSVEGPLPGTANFINPRERFEAHAAAHEPLKSPPPGRDLFVQLQVQDTGPGVEKEMQHRIFEPFVQADAGLSRKHSGTGLGLSISSQIVSLMGGTIGLESTLGEGCLFTVKLPLRFVRGSSAPRISIVQSISRIPSVYRMPPIRHRRTPDSLPTLVGPPSTDATQVTTATEWLDPDAKLSNPQLRKPGVAVQADKRIQTNTSQDLSKAKVLVAEDNKVNQEVILRMLKLEKILNVTIAADGKEALELVTKQEDRGHRFDLILMDVQMPVMDGHEATRLIREAGFKRPIVALTAFADQSNIDECYGSGMDYFLSKPIKRPLLKKVLSQYCLPAAAAEGEEATSDSANAHNLEEEAAAGCEKSDEN